MQKYIATNIHIPVDLWKAVKIRAAEEGRSMRALILEGLARVLGISGSAKATASGHRTLLKFAGKAKADVKDGSVEHDRYLYE